MSEAYLLLLYKKVLICGSQSENLSNTVLRLSHLTSVYSSKSLATVSDSKRRFRNCLGVKAESFF